MSLRKRLRHTGLARSLPKSSFKLERTSVPLTGRSRRMPVLEPLPAMISLSTIKSWTIFNYSMFVFVIVLYHAIPTLTFSRLSLIGIENITFLLLTSSSLWVEVFRGLLLIRLLLLMSPRWLVPSLVLSRHCQNVAVPIIFTRGHHNWKDIRELALHIPTWRNFEQSCRLEGCC